MQSRPIRHKKEKNTRIISIALVISRLIIIAGVWWVFFGSKQGSTTSTIADPSVNVEENADLAVEKVVEEKKWYIGEKILAVGVLTPTDSFTTYTHNFIDDEGTEFGLKSKDIELYKYADNVQLKGTIDDFKNDMPIILVTEIVSDSDGYETNTKNRETNEHYYYFQDEKIAFDLGISQGYTAEKQGDEIHLVDTTNDSVVLKISPFACTPGDNLRDCDALQRSMEQLGSDNFVSAQSIKFYNLTETITWVAFDPTGSFGYYLTPSDETQFASFSNLMSFVDEGVFKAEIDKNVASMCRDINYTMSSPSSYAYKYTVKGAVDVTLKETAADGTELICLLSLRLGNSLKTSFLSFSTDGDVPADNDIQDAEEQQEVVIEEKEEKEEVIEEDIDVVEEIAEPIALQGSSASDVPQNRSGAGWFHYNSVRGYDVYFSSKSISYAGNILSSAKEIAPGVVCVYKINVVHWKDADNVTTNPDIIVYECTGSEINTDTLQTVGTVGGKIFVAEWFSNDLGNMSIVVE